VLTGWAGQLSLGQLAPAAAGALVTAWTYRWGVPVPFAVLAGAVVGGMVGVTLGPVLLRLSGPFLAVGSLGLGVLVADWMLQSPVGDGIIAGPVRRPELAGFDFADRRSWYLACVVVLGFVLVGAQAFRRSSAGRALLASRDNERAATGLGVDGYRARVRALGMSWALAGLAGGMLVVHEGAATPGTYDAATGIQLVLMAVIGGLGSVPGALLGAAWFALITITLDGLGAQFLASGAFVLVLLMYFPSGLAGAALAVRDVWLRQVAERRGISVPALGTSNGDMPAPLLPSRRSDPTGRERSYVLDDSWVRDTGRSQRDAADRPTEDVVRVPG
jgi:branched-chain amino acid transport system permease protein